MRYRMDSREFQRAVSWVLAVLLIYFLYQIVEPFLVPLTWAAVLAIFCYPIHRAILGKLRRRNVAAFISVFALTVVLIAPITLLVPAFVREAIEIVGGASAQNVLPTVKALPRRLENRRFPDPNRRSRTAAFALDPVRLRTYLGRRNG